MSLILSILALALSVANLAWLARHRRAKFVFRDGLNLRAQGGAFRVSRVGGRSLVVIDGTAIEKQATTASDAEARRSLGERMRSVARSEVRKAMAPGGLLWRRPR